MLYFLLLIVLFILVLPFLRLAWRVGRGLLQMRRFYKDPEAFMNGRARRASTGNGTRQKAHSGKKIAKDVGEYVEYTEIRSYSSGEIGGDGQSSAKTTYSESQITDVEWEDL